MRKIDYTYLAASIRRQLDDAKTQQNCCREVTIANLEKLAREFAMRAHVDAPAFLAACGIS